MRPHETLLLPRWRETSRSQSVFILGAAAPLISSDARTAPTLRLIQGMFSPSLGSKWDEMKTSRQLCEDARG